MGEPGAAGMSRVGRGLARARVTVRTSFRELRQAGLLGGQLVRVTVATTVAYEAGTITDSRYPIFAALAALLVVQVTLFETLTRSWQRVTGVILGVLLAYAVGSQFGIHWWTIAATVLVATFAGQLLRLGPGGATQTPVSALMMLLIGSAAGGYAVARIGETLIGAAVGIAVVVLWPPTPRTRNAGESVQRLALSCALILDHAASGLRTSWPHGADAWLDEARRLTPLLEQSRLLVNHAVTSVRLNPRGTRLVPAAQRRTHAWRTLEHVAFQVRGIMRTLADDAADPQGGSTLELRDALAATLSGAAASLRCYATLARMPQLGEDSDEAVRLRESLIDARTAVRRAVAMSVDDPAFEQGFWLTHGAVLTDVNRVLDELDGKAQQDLLNAVLPAKAAKPLPPRTRTWAARRGTHDDNDGR